MAHPPSNGVFTRDVNYVPMTEDCAEDLLRQVRPWPENQREDNYRKVQRLASVGLS